MTDSASPEPPVLEAAAQAFVEATANPPYLFDMAVAEGRTTVDAAAKAATAQGGDFLRPRCGTADQPPEPYGRVRISM